jgi:hypothetical protein
MLRGASTLLMVVAVVAVVGFMYWLDRKTDSLGTEVAPVLQEQGAESEGVELEAVALAADPAAAVGQTGWLRGVSVDQRLGRGAFAVRLDEASTFPVLLSADLRAEWVTQTAVDQEHASAIPASPSFMFADSLSFN